MIIDSRFRFAMRTGVLVLGALFAGLVLLPRASAGYTYVRATTIPESALIQRAALAATLQGTSDRKPLILQVGAHVLYVQADIPGSEYVDPGEEDAGLKTLRARVASRDDFVRLGLITAPEIDQPLPYSGRHVADFEERYCYDRFWDDRPDFQARATLAAGMFSWWSEARDRLCSPTWSEASSRSSATRTSCCS